MKIKDYAQALRLRGFKVLELSKYQGVNVYVKEHKFNKVVCRVYKDTHGKAQEMVFNIVPNFVKNEMFTPKTMDEFNQAEFDRSYLVQEAKTLYKVFNELKQIKAPKCVYVHL